MIPKLRVLFIFACTCICNAQNYQTVADINDACSQLGFTSNEEAEIAVDNILSQIGLFKNFVIQECPDINNAVAKMIELGTGDKERYILYDAQFFKRIEDKADNDWSATSILAHEIGHHLNGHALNNKGSNHKWELQADEFSGFVLAKMGATLEDSQSAIQTLRYEKATTTHPAKADRLLAIEDGYNRGLNKTIVVKKIDEEIIKEITENVKEEIIDDEPQVGYTDEDEYITADGITAEQVFSNYIDAIGGQENIINIKTLIKNSTTTIFTERDGEIEETEGQAKMTMLTPNNFILDGETLQLDGKLYTKNTSDKWKLMPGNVTTSNNLLSYIWEYSLLLTKAEAVFLGIKLIDGAFYYAVRIPKTEIVSDDSNMTVYNTNYYSIDSGLLAYMKVTAVTVVDSNNDLKSTMQIMTSYLDYRSVNGVLFPFRQKTKNLGLPISIITEYTDIQVNPEINRDNFDPTK